MNMANGSCRGQVSLPVPTWQAEALATLSEFDSAKDSNGRMKALNKLQPLFAGGGALKEVLRKCLALAKRASDCDVGHDP